MEDLGRAFLDPKNSKKTKAEIMKMYPPKNNERTANLNADGSGGTTIYPSFKKILETNIGQVVKIMPYRLGKTEILFILNKKGRLFRLNVDSRDITELSYTGEFCQNILFFSHSSLKVTLLCHTMSNTVSFYFVD